MRQWPPDSNYCLHGIPSGWSHVAPFAVRRPAHRPRHALVSTCSRGRCHVRVRPLRWPYPASFTPTAVICAGEGCSVGDVGSDVLDDVIGWLDGHIIAID